MASKTSEELNLTVLGCGRALAAESVSEAPGWRLVRLPCSSKSEPELILNAFLGGSDGVALIPCPRGACQYVEGNRRAASMARGAADLMAQVGLEPERFAVYPLEADRRTGILGFLALFKEELEELGRL